MRLATCKSGLTYFVVGCALGLCIASLYHNIQLTTYVQYARAGFNSPLFRQSATPDSNIESENKTQSHQSPILKFEDQHLHNDDTSIADNLYKKVRVLCWVMTSPKTLHTKAIHVRDTWGKRCNKILFMSSVYDPDFPAVGLNVSEGREHLTEKTMQAFKYVHDNYLDAADWFMKVDDDTYVIVENLRYLLSDKDPNEPVYFGHHFKTIVKQGYFSGGAGYVLSKQALISWHKSKARCRQDGGAEDAEMGKCMERTGVKVGNSTDAFGRSRFHCFNAPTHLHGGYPGWYYKYDANGAKKNYLSDYAVSFHYVPPKEMYTMEYYVYHLRPFGIASGSQDLNAH